MKNGSARSGCLISFFLWAAIFAVFVLVTGCASLDHAGVASYKVKPFDAAGKTLCCEVEIVNGKQIASLDATIEKRGDDYTVVLKQRGVEAFRGQAIAAGAVTATATTAAKAATAIMVAPAAAAVGGAAIRAIAQ